MTHRPAVPGRVPTTAQVVRGAAVNIVLKQDQPTGRTVAGEVRDVLTRGNHPRGIKVRLSDGRVGRVQSLNTGPIPPPDAATAAVRDDHAPAPELGVRTDGGPRGRGMARDVRLDELEYGAPPPERGLDAFVIKPAKVRGGNKKNKAKAKKSSNDAAEASETSRCPVCEDFQGDEAAVAHHVAAHFDQP